MARIRIMFKQPMLLLLFIAVLNSCNGTISGADINTSNIMDLNPYMDSFGERITYTQEKDRKDNIGNLSNVILDENLNIVTELPTAPILLDNKKSFAIYSDKGELNQYDSARYFDKNLQSHLKWPQLKKRLNYKNGITKAIYDKNTLTYATLNEDRTTDLQICRLGWNVCKIFPNAPCDFSNLYKTLYLTAKETDGEAVFAVCKESSNSNSRRINIYATTNSEHSKWKLVHHADISNNYLGFFELIKVISNINDKTFSFFVPSSIGLVETKIDYSLNVISNNQYIWQKQFDYMYLYYLNYEAYLKLISRTRNSFNFNNKYIWDISDNDSILYSTIDKNNSINLSELCLSKYLKKPVCSKLQVPIFQGAYFDTISLKDKEILKYIVYRPSPKVNQKRELIFYIHGGPIVSYDRNPNRLVKLYNDIGYKVIEVVYTSGSNLDSQGIINANTFNVNKIASEVNNAINIYRDNSGYNNKEEKIIILSDSFGVYITSIISKNLNNVKAFLLYSGACSFKYMEQDGQKQIQRDDLNLDPIYANLKKIDAHNCKDFEKTDATVVGISFGTDKTLGTLSSEIFDKAIERSKSPCLLKSEGSYHVLSNNYNTNYELAIKALACGK